MPIKGLTDFAKTTVNHTNAKIRESAINLFKTIYKHTGEQLVSVFLRDNKVNALTLKNLETELSKVTEHSSEDK